MLLHPLDSPHRPQQQQYRLRQPQQPVACWQLARQRNGYRLGRLRAVWLSALRPEAMRGDSDLLLEVDAYFLKYGL